MEVIKNFENTHDSKYIIELISILKSSTDYEYIFNNLKDLLVYLDIYYHNGESLISDELYDNLFNIFQVVCIKLNLDIVLVLNEINVRTFNDKMIRDDIKTELPFRMPGLRKVTTEEDLNKWLNRYKSDQEIIITPKLDGISVLLDVKNKMMYTRGDNKNGFKFNDYIHRVTSKNFKFPGMNNKVYQAIEPDNIIEYDDIGIDFTNISYIRGELIMSKSNFEVFKKKYPKYITARNLVAGMVNKKIYPKEKYDSIDLTDFIGYEIIYPEYSFEKQLNILYSNHIKCVSYIKMKVKDITYDYLVNLIHSMKNQNYDYDGVVLRTNTLEEYPDLMPKYQLAVKLPSRIYTVVVNDIEWNINIRGIYIPTLIFDQIEYNNKFFSRASGYNFLFLINNDIHIGSEIGIQFNGEIPTIISNEITKNEIPKNEIPKDEITKSLNLPIDSVIEDNELYSSNPKANLAKLIVASIKALGITGLSVARIQNQLLTMKCQNVIEFINESQDPKFNHLKTQTIDFKDLFIALNTHIKASLVKLFKINPNFSNTSKVPNFPELTKNKIQNALTEYNDNLVLINKTFNVVYPFI